MKVGTVFSHKTFASELQRSNIPNVLHYTDRYIWCVYSSPSHVMV